MLRMLELIEEINDCYKCPLRTHVCPRTPMYQCDFPAHLMIVAYAPSVEEELLEAGWVDRHNRYVKKLLTTQFPFNTMYFTYLLKCLPDKGFSKKLVSTCVDNFLLEEIKLVQPKIVLGLGNYVCKILMGKREKGSLLKKDNVWYTWYDSASALFNAGKSKEKEFTDFIASLKILESKYV